MRSLKNTVLIGLLLALVAVFSFCVLGARFSSDRAYTKTIESIEAKSGDSLRLATAATVASAGITLLPDDVATPVADKIADFTGYFLAAMCIMYAAKFVLPLAGFAVFRILIPLICVFVFIWLATGRGRGFLKTVVRLTVFALLIWMAVPVSVRASDMVYGIYDNSIRETVSATEKLTEDVSAFSSAEEATFLEKATGIVNRMIEVLAITIATSCLIPIIVLAFFIWLAKLLLETELTHTGDENEQQTRKGMVRRF